MITARASLRRLRLGWKAYLLVITIGSGLQAASTPRAPTEANAVKAGFAERDITPSLGTEKPGGYGKNFNTSFHDPCKVRVAVFDDGKQKIALVGLDALVVPRSVVIAARAQ